MMGVYGLKNIQINEGSSIYGALGFTLGRVTISGNGSSGQDTDTDLSFGVGAEFGSFNIELMQYLNKSDFDFSALSIGWFF